MLFDCDATYPEPHRLVYELRKPQPTAVVGPYREPTYARTLTACTSNTWVWDNTSYGRTIWSWDEIRAAYWAYLHAHLDEPHPGHHVPARRDTGVRIPMTWKLIARSAVRKQPQPATRAHRREMKRILASGKRW